MALKNSAFPSTADTTYLLMGNTQRGSTAKLYQWTGYILASYVILRLYFVINGFQQLFILKASRTQSNELQNQATHGRLLSIHAVYYLSLTVTEVRYEPEYRSGGSKFGIIRFLRGVLLPLTLCGTEYSSKN
ncbi:hypothetical protein [Marinomonas mediterranea]|uniref:Uncharacterized protein n=1 Tax=Marinomonas mediterranea (strain ATCC 700492 / JCM 21426 / NBRC 103028 / MMB-1) TaxID=717774 RepID=F2K3A6_MARM1|nr:hypothetical protein [Marinomonas mediterranea]ADZ91248.1 hypothetical protein Marme_2000 [Marinomonas mediterranea MMB-1]WCN09221.1 hypothetical protein GV055_09935 [Marinomonas mediterranea]